MKLGFPLPASHSPPQTLQARALYNRHFISGWNAVTSRGVRTEWGRGRQSLETETPGWDFSRSRIGILDWIGGVGRPWDKAKGEPAHLFPPSSTNLAKGSSRQGDWVGGGPPICPGHLPISPLPLKSSLGWIQFLFSLTKRAVSITGREGRLGAVGFGPTCQPAGFH